MNPRQRRGIVFMVLAAVIALGVFLAVASYVASVQSQVGSLTTVYEAAAPIEPYTALSAQNLRPVQVPQRWTSATSRLDLADLEQRRLGFRVEPGTVISSDMLLPDSALYPDEREIAINVDAVTGIGGRVRTGNTVDVYAVFKDVPRVTNQVRVLVRNVRVVSIGGVQQVQQNDETTGISQQQVVPVTLALRPEDAKAVTFANAFAEEVRLVGLPTDVGTDRGGETSVFDAGSLLALTAGPSAPATPRPRVATTPKKSSR